MRLALLAALPLATALASGLLWPKGNTEPRASIPAYLTPIPVATVSYHQEGPTAASDRQLTGNSKTMPVDMPQADLAALNPQWRPHKRDQELRRRDICQRHGMRKTHISRFRWRCR